MTNAERRLALNGHMSLVRNKLQNMRIKYGKDIEDFPMTGPGANWLRLKDKEDLIYNLLKALPKN